MTEAAARFESAGDELAVTAPRPLPVDLLVDLRCHREALLDRHRERASIREADAGTPRAEAERLAAADVMTWLAECGQAERLGTMVPKPAAETGEPFVDIEGELGFSPSSIGRAAL